MITIKVQKRELFLKYLEWIDPILKLKDLDRKVLAALLSLHYTYRDYNNIDVLNEILFSSTVRQDLIKRLEISESQFSKSIKSLEEKGLIEDNKLHPTLTRYPKDGKFKIAINFVIDESS